MSFSCYYVLYTVWSCLYSVKPCCIADLDVVVHPEIQPIGKLLLHLVIFQESLLSLSSRDSETIVSHEAPANIRTLLVLLEDRAVFIQLARINEI
jgi:hypothetical protein